jgi:hypothetical protein
MWLCVLYGRTPSGLRTNSAVRNRAFVFRVRTSCGWSRVRSICSVVLVKVTARLTVSQSGSQLVSQSVSQSWFSSNCGGSRPDFSQCTEYCCLSVCLSVCQLSGALSGEFAGPSLAVGHSSLCSGYLHVHTLRAALYTYVQGLYTRLLLPYIHILYA